VSTCKRCDYRQAAKDSALCEHCWVELGQMAFWHDEEDDGPEPFHEDDLHPVRGKP
jgi:hypothetical protein